MTDFSHKWLVETEWLAQHLDAPDLVIVDGSWHLPNSDRNAYEEYLAEHIPCALFFDIDEISDTSSDLPHMLPSPVKFSSRMRRMGIGDGMRVCVYDSYGIFSAARVWWTFRVMGITDVVVLNGGLKKWKAEGRPVEDLPPPRRTERHFTSRLNQELVSDFNEILENLDGSATQIVDARPQKRFAGQAPEPREGLRLGHIPGSYNLPSANLINEDGTLKSAEEIRSEFSSAGIDLTKPVIASCGSGITASVLALALALIGHRHTSVYDGSWAEWGASSTLPIETD